MAEEQIGTAYKKEQQAKEHSAPKSGDHCPECGSNHLVRDYDVQEIICHNCGTVISQPMATGPERRAFDAEERAATGRSGLPSTFTIHDKGLSTVIDWRDRKRDGSLMSPAERLDMYKLRKWQRRARVSDSNERNLAVALSYISKYSSDLNLPRNLIETACVNYRRTLRKQLVRGRSTKLVALGAIYMACRQTETPRTLDEVAAVGGVEKKDLGRVYRKMREDVDTYDVKPHSYKEFASRLSNKLGLSGRTESLAIRTLDAAYKAKLISGRGPTGLAAAATYIACKLNNERKTQREIAEITQVTEVTIRNRYKEFMKRLFIEVPM